MKTFTVASIKNLLNQVFSEEITISRFVEMLNEQVSLKNTPIEKFENESWFQWLSESKSHGLNEGDTSDAIRDIANKLNEIIERI
jgi:hypothetical protein